MGNFRITDIYCITDHAHSKGRTSEQVVHSMIESGIEVIQYREKFKSMKEKLEECIRLREMTRKSGVTFIVNDHIDLALLCEADGVHIGQDDLPPSEVRKLIGNDRILGLSTHSPKQAVDAESCGYIDYIGVGPVFKTYTKKDVCDPVGFEYVEYVSKNINLPFVAIGGIKEHNIAEVKKRGAECFALVTEITEAEDINKKIENIRNQIKK